MKFAFAVVLSLLAGVATAQTLAPVDPGGIPTWSLFAVGALCLVAGGLAGNYVGKNPAAADAAVAAARADGQKIATIMQGALTSAHATIAALVNKAEGKTAAPPVAVAPGTGSVAAAAATGVSPAATPAWTLGTSYPSLPALLADAAPRTTQMIRLNDAPIAGFTLPNPVDFYTWPDGGVAQTKPA